MIYLHKILPLLVSPLSLVIIVLIWGAVFRRTAVSLIGIIFLTVCSLPVVSNGLVSYLERGYSLGTASTVRSADAVVVLSGMVRAIEVSKGPVYEWTEASDRIFAGINLIEKGKAPLLILTGGKLPWSIGKPEGEHLKEIAVKYGIPSQMIRITEDVQNTDQEAKAVAKLLNQEVPEVILVTSAFHMPRAQMVFESAGIEVLPFPVDFLTGAKGVKILDFIPSAEAFRDTSFFVREIIGRLYYRVM